MCSHGRHCASLVNRWLIIFCVPGDWQAAHPNPMAQCPHTFFNLCQGKAFSFVSASFVVSKNQEPVGQARSTTETIGIWINLGWICVNSSYGWAAVVDVHSLLIMFRASCESSISISSHLISSSNLTSLLHHYPIVVPWSILHCPIKHHAIIMSIMHVSASDCNKIFSRPFRFAAVALQETEGLCLLQGRGGTSCQPICPSHHGTCSIPRSVMLLKQLATAWPRR